jgi:hypothetical protein
VPSCNLFNRKRKLSVDNRALMGTMQEERESERRDSEKPVNSLSLEAPDGCTGLSEVL